MERSIQQTDDARNDDERQQDDWLKPNIAHRQFSTSINGTCQVCETASEASRAEPLLCQPAFEAGTPPPAPNV